MDIKYSTYGTSFEGTPGVKKNTVAKVGWWRIDRIFTCWFSFKFGQTPFYLLFPFAWLENLCS